MPHNRLAATAIAVLTVILMFGSVPSAHAAKVTTKNVPTQSAIVKIYPQLRSASASYRTETGIVAPKKKCGNFTKYSGKGLGLRLRSGSKMGQATVVKLKSKKAARNTVKRYKRYVKHCKRHRLSGTTYIVKKRSLPKVGRSRVGYQRKIGGQRVSFVVIQKVKRVGLASVAQTSQSKKKLKRLAKLTARRM